MSDYKVITTIQGAEIRLYPDGRVTFRADMDIDCDGSGGNPDRDPYFQPDTSLHVRGRALNAYKEPFIVVPPIVIRSVKPVVLGCRARVTNLKNGRVADAVVGDIGPTRKVGEGSPYLAKMLGINPNPNHGGMDSFDVIYELWPGESITIEGITYPLQPKGA